MSHEDIDPTDPFARGPSPAEIRTSRIRAALAETIDLARQGRCVDSESARRTLVELASEYRDGVIRLPAWVEAELHDAGMSTTAPATETPIEYTTYGKVRGQGPIYTTLAEAESSLRRDRRQCAAQGGYSDRIVCRVTATDRLETLGGEPVWPGHGRTTGAARVVR